MPPPLKSSLSEWLRYIEAIHPSEIDLGLERLQRVFESLIEPSNIPFVFTVAGTNGKGTTTGLLSSLSLAAGKKVGWYSSPHLLTFNERVRINNIPVSDALLVEAFAVVEDARGEVSLSYFEYTTLAAFYVFSKSDLDIWVLEIGLGGRLDAVNVVEPEISIVTNIGFDHQSFLGDTLPEIAREKFGIARTNKPLVTGSDSIPEEAVETAVSNGVSVFEYGKTHGWNGEVLTTQNYRFTQPELRLPAQNAAAALQAWELSPFELSENAILTCLKQSVLPGRLQEFERQGRKIIVDVGHNPHAATYISSQLAPESFHVLIGMLEDKDGNAFCEALSPITASLNTLTLSVPRGQTADVLANRLSSPVENRFETLESAMSYFDSHLPGQNLFIGGSFYTVCAALEQLEG